MMNKILASTLACFIVINLCCSSLYAVNSARVDPMYWIIWEHGFREGQGEVLVNGKFGFINSSGQVTIKPKFNQVFPFSNGFAVVRRGAIINTPKAGSFGQLFAGYFMYINKNDQVLWKGPGFPFSEGFATVLIGTKWGILSEALGEEPKFSVINTSALSLVN